MSDLQGYTITALLIFSMVGIPSLFYLFTRKLFGGCLGYILFLFCIPVMMAVFGFVLKLIFG
ncbi:hypothetical protein NDK43_11135 [Neobacillus pocheonensis]|uniref:Uncharacterized protein n=1 Tax=Neobacillus pocheonensis TaxID=363869 RepID=A0ABT0W960_9BACI|nr:hypothetical protein [Neobacillus pocheonensis]